MVDLSRKYTRYERTRIIAARALQLAQGSPPFIKVPRALNTPLEIAQFEWNKGVIPIDVKRRE
ncbi:MAG: DNA-directed RNA polymerase subunit K [Nanoarchaeota archaeon]|nr:DNA-directed RNA polymerase subunit K [Nanoarchaeota archaeon]